jgi:hypothetical protein
MKVFALTKNIIVRISSVEILSDNAGFQEKEK